MSRKRAVALRYRSQSDRAPKVIAKGAGPVAEAIVEAAKQSSVQVMENDALLHSLMQLEINDVIPEELYTAVAEILAYVYRLSNE